MKLRAIILPTALALGLTFSSVQAASGTCRLAMTSSEAYDTLSYFARLKVNVRSTQNYVEEAQRVLAVYYRAKETGYKFTQAYVIRISGVLLNHSVTIDGYRQETSGFAEKCYYRQASQEIIEIMRKLNKPVVIYVK